MPLRYLPVEIQATTLKLCAHQNRPQLPSSWPWVFSASQPVCVSATPVSRSARLSHSKHASHVHALFRHRPSRQQPPVRLGPTEAPAVRLAISWQAFSFPLPLRSVSVSPDGRHSLHSTGLDSSWGCCNCNKYIWSQVRLRHVPLLSQLSLLSPNDEIPHNVLVQLVVLLKSSIIASLCCVPGECASYIFFRRTCPGSSLLYFHFVVFALTTVLAPGRRVPRTTPWGETRTHLNHSRFSSKLHVLWSCST